MNRGRRRDRHRSAESEMKDWGEVDKLKQGAGSRDTVKHVEKNDQLFVTRTMWWMIKSDQR